jgi:hypothetical protein
LSSYQRFTTLLADLDFVDFSDKTLFSDASYFCRDIEIGGKVNQLVKRHNFGVEDLVQLINITAAIPNLGARAYIIQTAMTDQRPKLHSSSRTTVWNHLADSSDPDLPTFNVFFLLCSDHGQYGAMRSATKK